MVCAIDELLQEVFSPPLRHALVDCLQDGCRAAAHRFSESEGCNAYTFGTDAYHFNTFRLKRLVAQREYPLIELATPSELEFRLRVGGRLNLACHRVGSTADQPIRDCFPSSAGGPGKMARANAEQLTLALELPDTVLEPENVVLAYMANPECGLEAVYLAVPVGSSEGGRINEWAHTVPIWRLDYVTSAAAIDLPPEIPVDEAPMVLRPRLGAADARQL